MNNPKWEDTEPISWEETEPIEMEQPTSQVQNGFNPTIQDIPMVPYKPSQLNMQTAMETASPLQSRFGQVLESAGERVSDVTQKSIGNIVGAPSRTNLPPEISATAGTIGQTVAEAGKLTPSNMTMMIGGEVLPATVLKSVIGKFPKSIANRFLNTPKAIAESRYLSGKPSTGEEYLKREIFNPKGIGELPTSDKDKIFNIASNEIKRIGVKVKSEIDKLFKQGITPDAPSTNIEGTPLLEYNPTVVENATPIPKPRTTSGKIGMEYVEPKVGTIGSFQEAGQATQPVKNYRAGGGKFVSGSGKGMVGEGEQATAGHGFFKKTGQEELNKYPFTGIKKEPNVDVTKLEISNKLYNDILDSVSSDAGKWSDESASILNKVKGNQYLDFKTANELRQLLGDYVGKRFQSQEVPEKMDAVIKLFGSLRDKIGQISPKLDNMLAEQHVMFDIKNSVLPEAAKGYSKIPYNIGRTLMTPFESPKVASVLESTKNTRFFGGGVYPKTPYKQ